MIDQVIRLENSHRSDWLNYIDCSDINHSLFSFTQHDSSPPQ